MQVKFGAFREPATDLETAEALQLGVTPQKVENAYRNRCVRDVGRQYCLEQAQMSALAVRWGIDG